MKLNTQQIKQLNLVCQWIIAYDYDLPNRDGVLTETAVNNAKDFIASQLYQQECFRPVQQKD